jgi:anhydro-N-acetylmuramic acid kinase
VHRPFNAALRDELLALQQPGPNELHRAALAGNGVALAYAEVVRGLLDLTQRSPETIAAIGAHGQTVRHQPGAHDGHGYTLQLLNGALLAELTSIDVIADLRSRDVAAGGQGAPLVPAFHAAVFASATRHRAVLNIGGMANVSVLSAPGHDAPGHVTGFDTGPGGALLDGWCARHRGLDFDADGAWAASGEVDAPLLNRLLAEPFFSQPPPRSTGRDLFNLAWLDDALRTLAKESGGATPGAVDVQATLAELTAASVADALLAQCDSLNDLIVCGGGARNGDLLRRLHARLRARWPAVRIESSAAHGIPVDQVEAAAFAWLAQRHLALRSGNLPAVTGASGLRVLGARHPGRPAAA